LVSEATSTHIAHFRGAKTALTLALRSPDLVTNVVAIDNAPVNLPLLEDFPRYVAGMKRVEAACVQTLAEADDILKDYEKVPTH
jgi:pimeloyl-ACP methyl ester carboxylesterase